MSFTKSAIQESLRKEDGQYYLKKKEGRSGMWLKFGQVCHVETGLRLSFHACYSCKTVYTDSGGGTGNITRHRCPPASQIDISFLYSDTLKVDSAQEKGEILNLSDILSQTELLPNRLIKEEPIDAKESDIFSTLLSQEIKKEVDEEPIDESQLSLALQLTQQKHFQIKVTSQDRLMKTEIHQLLAAGSPEIVLEKHHKYETISFILRYSEDAAGYKELKKTLYVICTVCGTMLRNAEGGHINRHVQTSCPGSAKLDFAMQLPSTSHDETPKNDLVEVNSPAIFATFCLKTCQEFNVVLEPSFLSILDRAGNQTKRLPKVEEVETAALRIYRDLKSNMKSQVKKLINQGEAVLLVDPGIYIPDVLSVFINFTTNDTSKSLYIRNNPLPIGFSPFFERTDDPEKLFKQILSICTEFELSKEEVQACALCSEPLTVLMECGKMYMNDHYPVVSVPLEPIIKMVLSPSDSFYDRLNPQEQTVCNLFRDILKTCEAISQETKDNFTMETLGRKIARVNNKDEWFGRLSLLLDVFINWEDIFIRREFFTTVNIEELTGKKEHFNEVLEIFKLFQNINKILHKDGVYKLNMVVSCYKRLQNDLRNLSKDSSKSNTFRTLAEVAIKAVDIYCQEIFVKTYYLASTLCPTTKNFKLITPEEKKMTIENLIILCRNNDNGEPATKKKRIENAECEAEVVSYLSHIVPKNTSLLAFWGQNSSTYKHLSRITRIVFACSPIDSLCKNYKSLVGKWIHTGYLEEQKEHQWVLLASALIKQGIRKNEYE